MKAPRNHYQNLKVDRKATTAQIRKAYRSLASLHHPDRNGNSLASVKAMQCINAAYEVLTDSAKRATHDAWIARTEYVRPAGYDQAQRQANEQKRSEPKYESAQPKYEPKRENWNKYESHTWFGDDMDSMFARWRSPPTLNPAHKPKDFDEKHRDDFIKYNDAMRKMLTGINLEYVTPELIYRSFLIDLRRGKGAPKNLKKAYKAINRAMKVEKSGALSRIADLYLNLNGFVQGILAACAFFAFLSLTVFLIVRL